MTVEGIGSVKTGLNPIQSRLAGCHGTQCGYCSSGMVMQMNSYLEATPNPTVDDIEDILDGNICRCTGYRPILDAFKSFASDSPKHLDDKLKQLPETAQVKFVAKNKKCSKAKQPLSRTSFKTEDGTWWVPSSLNDLLDILGSFGDKSKYRLVAGNTAMGVYPNDGPYTNYIDVRKLAELSVVIKTPELVIGGNVTLTNFIDVMEEMAKNDPKNYSYCSQIVTHVKKVAHTSVRNSGTIAGNLMMKHAHKDFPSDIFLLLEAVGVQLVIKDVSKNHQRYYYPINFHLLTKEIAFCLFIQLFALCLARHNHEAKSFVSDQVSETEFGRSDLLFIQGYTS